MNNFIFLFIYGVLFIINPILGKYESDIQSIELLGADKEVTVFVRSQRISRGIYGVSANITLRQDLDDTFLVEIHVYRSAMGNNQFQKLPYGGSSVGNLTISEFANNFYKPYAMTSVQNCSNFPQFEEKMPMPLKAGFYYADSCLLNDEKIPDYLQPGLYKVEGLVVKGERRIGVRILVRITKKLN